MSGRSYNKDRAADTNNNACMANPAKSSVKVTDKKTANFQYHFHRPFAVTEAANKPYDLPLSVG